MAKYTVTCESCGSDMTVNLIGKHTTRQWKLENYTWKCDDCIEKERQEKLKIQLENDVKNKLPELTGSEKQVKWAVTIRQTILDKIELHLKEESETEEFKQKLEIFKSQTSAKYLIDNRNNAHEAVMNMEIPKSNDELVKEYQEEEKHIIRKTESNEVVEISVKEHIISLKFKRDDLFRKIAKENKYSWSYDSSSWVRSIENLNGNVIDRVVEIATKLLNNDFNIRVDDINLKDLILEGEYEEEVTKWIYRKDDNSVYIIHKPDSVNYYNEIKRLPGAIYKNYQISVPVKSYKEIIDFANEYDYKITKKASDLFDMMKEIELSPILSNKFQNKISEDVKVIKSENDLSFLKDL